MRALVVIPARYGSTRFEGKPLADLAGKPMIVHVWERARAAKTVTQVVVATDDNRIKSAVEVHGGEARLTASTHPTGTDRVAEVARGVDCDLVVNVQGDEPLLEPGMVDEVIDLLREDQRADMSTLMMPITSDEEFQNPNVVKVVADLNGNALYFSRGQIPYPRVRNVVSPQVHIGIYGYRREFLLRFTQLKPTPLEQTESLEQLRALEHGYRIRVAQTRYPYPGVSVDTPADLELVAAILAKASRGA
ncbi:MAG TPA: 3-deoxy-manno-octulosonate cytidylyltransferase [bacterium]|nr:3-deoxy-manno-octulosonate cytidylyltransferase [bacterium]